MLKLGTNRAGWVCISREGQTYMTSRWVQGGHSATNSSERQALALETKPYSCTGSRLPKAGSPSTTGAPLPGSPFSCLPSAGSRSTHQRPGPLGSRPPLSFLLLPGTPPFPRPITQPAPAPSTAEGAPALWRATQLVAVLIGAIGKGVQKRVEKDGKVACQGKRR